MSPTVRRRLRVEGVVQGVGFRPCVYRLAAEHRLSGFVRNDACGVEIEVQGEPDRVEGFVDELPGRIPPMSSVSRLEVEEIPVVTAGADEFRIVKSEGTGQKRVAVTPDAHVCDDCLRELADPRDRRFRYPFINCTNCGPRFSIVRAVPYDRPNTTMAAFPLCEGCRREYEDPLDRRFHAQPVACPACGPRIWLADPAGEPIPADDVVAAARERLRAGEILAVKGVGGFHLAVDATNEEAVARLREHKGRISGKPFALMCRDSDQAREIAEISGHEAELLASVARPIVLLRRRDEAGLATSIAPGLSTVGVMIPYTPLHHLLLEPPLPPLVMTSGNPGAEPITTDNEEALVKLGPLCDALLLHDRGIHTGCDDSVCLVTGGERQLLRRSRGYVPRPFDVRHLPVEGGIVALGGELKVAICLSREGQLVVGRHLGDLSNAKTRRSLRPDVDRLAHILGVEPQVVVHDLHPDYFSTALAQSWDGVERLAVQHHHAHLASCLVEHDVPLERPALGVIYDGTGYGPDGTAWGGELLVGGFHQRCERAGHLRPVALPGGDAAVLSPYRTALSFLIDAFGDEALELDLPPLGQHPRARLRDLGAMVRAGINAPRASGMGRLFDAAAAILGLPGGLADPIGYEAQPAMELEAAAGEQEAEPYPYGLTEAGEIDHRPLIRALARDVLSGAPAPLAAARFHETVVRFTVEAALNITRDKDLDLVALSGGCFHNRRLLRGVIRGLEAHGLEVLRHHRVPCGDGGLSLGQAAIAAAWVRGQRGCRPEAGGRRLGDEDREPSTVNRSEGQ